MEFSHTIVPAEDLLRVQVWGQVTADDLIEAMRRLGVEPDYRPGMSVLADLREAHSRDWDYSEAQRVRDYLVRASRSWHGARWAVVVRPGALEAVGRIVIVITEALSSGITIRLFEDPADAMRWLQQ